MRMSGNVPKRTIQIWTEERKLKRQIRKLIIQLGNKDAAKRRAAEDSLLSLGPDLLPRVSEALERATLNRRRLLWTLAGNICILVIADAAMFQFIDRGSTAWIGGVIGGSVPTSWNI